MHGGLEPVLKDDRWVIWRPRHRLRRVQRRGAVHAIGDSITAGVTIPGAYRAGLRHRFVNDGYQVGFAGSLSTGPADLGDHDHEGRSGGASTGSTVCTPTRRTPSCCTSAPTTSCTTMTWRTHWPTCRRRPARSASAGQACRPGRTRWPLVGMWCLIGVDTMIAAGLGPRRSVRLGAARPCAEGSS